MLYPKTLVWPRFRVCAATEIQLVWSLILYLFITRLLQNQVTAYTEPTPIEWHTCSCKLVEDNPSWSQKNYKYLFFIFLICGLFISQFFFFSLKVSFTVRVSFSNINLSESIYRVFFLCRQ